MLRGVHVSELADTPLPQCLLIKDKIRGLYLQGQMDMSLSPILIVRKCSISQITHMHPSEHEVQAVLGQNTASAMSPTTWTSFSEGCMCLTSLTVLGLIHPPQYEDWG